MESADPGIAACEPDAKLIRALARETTAADGFEKLVAMFREFDRTPSQAPDRARIAVEFANAFLAILRRRSDWVEAGEARRVLLARAIAMAIEAAQALWLGTIEAGEAQSPWRTVHTLFLLAEANGCEGLEVAVGGEKCTVRAVYIRMLLLDLLQPELSPPQLRLAAAALGPAARRARLDSEPLPVHRFRIDLGADAGPAPVDDGRIDGDLRFIDIAGWAPATPAQGSGVDAMVTRSLASLARDLQPPREEHDQRSDDRIRLRDQQVQVLKGLQPLLDSMGKASMSGGATWRVHDISSHGYAFLAPAAEVEGVESESLVALRHARADSWIPCAIRRTDLVTHAPDAMVAMEVLHFHPALVRLVPTDASPGFAALYLPGPDEDGTSDALLLPATQRVEGRLVEMVAGGQRFRLRLGHALRGRGDWVLAAFDVGA